jgi:hypothetical protein
MLLMVVVSEENEFVCALAVASGRDGDDDVCTATAVVQVERTIERGLVCQPVVVTIEEEAAGEMLG